MDNEEELLAEIFRIYQPPTQQSHPGFRVYYHADTKDIICFSQEELDWPYVQTTEQIYMAGRPDLYKIQDGELVKQEQYHVNRLQLKPNGVRFASIKGDMQFAVPTEYTESKEMWDAITD
jgi:hypothetical protein